MTDTNEISVSVKLEYWEAYRTIVLLNVRVVKAFLIPLAIVGSLWIALLVFAAVQPAPDKDWYRIARNSQPMVTLLGCAIAFLLGAPLLLARKFTDDAAPKNGIRYRFGQEGIHIETSVGSSDLKWEACREAAENAWAFRLSLRPRSLITFPKRCFANDHDVETFRELVRAKVARSKLR
jgi:YcxB-like protein